MEISRLTPCLVHPTLETLCIEFGVAIGYNLVWSDTLGETRNWNIRTIQLRQYNFMASDLHRLIDKRSQLRVFHFFGISAYDMIAETPRRPRLVGTVSNMDKQVSPAEIVELLRVRKNTLEEVRIDMNRWDNHTRSDPYYGRTPAQFIYHNLRDFRQLVELEIEAVRLDFNTCDMPASLERLTLTHCDQRRATSFSTLENMIHGLKQGPCPALKQAHLTGSWGEDVVSFFGGTEAAKGWKTTHWGGKAGAHVACCMQTTLTGTRKSSTDVATASPLVLIVTHMSLHSGRTWRDGYERPKLPPPGLD